MTLNMPKNLQLLRTNWYNCFRKSFMGYRVCKNWLLGTKGVKIAIGPQKRVPRGPKIRKSALIAFKFGFVAIMLGDPKGNLGELEGTLTYYQEMQHNCSKDDLL